ncbi:MAG: EAL domain-containing protein [Chromatiales bacterium]|nr:EAL domain-containing protein [Chromatiales bacterium]
MLTSPCVIGDSIVRLGVLAKRGVQFAESHWGATAEYLSAQIPDCTFQIVPLSFDEVIPAVVEQKVDFVLTNPSFYIELEAKYGASRIATLKNSVGDMVANQFGGVIFTRADRDDIQQLSDIVGKRFMGVEEASLGGFRMAWGMFEGQGIDLFNSVDLSFGKTHDAVVYAVLERKVDAGTVRTDTMERMAREGLISLGDFRVINIAAEEESDYFPFRRSTPLYPEWPFAILAHAPKELSETVAVALLQMPPDSRAALDSNSAGWGIPLNYQPVHELLKTLKVGPYKNYGVITYSDLLQKYWHLFIAGFFTLSAFGVAIYYVTRLNIQLGLSRESLHRAKATLEVRVQERTQDLVVINSELQQEIAERSRTQKMLEKVSSENRLLLDSAGEGIFGIDTQGRLTFINPAALQLLGWSGDELLGNSMHKITHFGGIEPYDCPVTDCPICSVITSRKSEKVVDDLFWRKDGTGFPVEYTSTPVIENGEVTGAVVVFEDITERKKMEQNLQQAAVVFETTVEGILVSDANNRIKTVNAAFTDITGYTSDDVLGKTPNILNSGHHSENFFQAMWDKLQKDGSWSGEIWNRRKNGQIFPEWLSINVVRDKSGEITNYIAIFSDISLIKDSERRLEYLAHHDPLTELPNRLLMQDRLTHAIKTAGRNNVKLAVLFLDLDRFKNINDTLGHQFGDKLLISVAERLEMSLREGDTVARLGGDEFIIILEQLDSINMAEKVAQKILKIISKPIKLDGVDLAISTSIGISVYPDDGDDSEALIKHADTAMYKAKEKGRNQYAVYTTAWSAIAKRRLSLENALRSALDRGELSLVYQPQIALADNQTIGVEALIRWNSEHGNIPPSEFIPLAEEIGMIIPIGNWVLREACCQRKRWFQQYGLALRVAVNISSYQIEQPGFFDTVQQILRETSTQPDMLELELTEGAVTKDRIQAAEFMSAAKKIGIGIAIDDFGTGYSSLSYLKDLPVDCLKIDRYFVKDIPHHSDDMAICSTLVALAHNLRLRVVAEGVETSAQYEFLKTLGCDSFQGYLFGGTPVGPDKLPGLIEAGII